MTNKQIANAFDELANLMELHGEDDFRIRSYRNAYLTLRKVDRPLSELDEAELKAIKGVGDAIAKKSGNWRRAAKWPPLKNTVKKPRPASWKCWMSMVLAPKKSP